MQDKNKLSSLVLASPLSKEELEWLKKTFGGEDNFGLGVLRKLFLPSPFDPSTPIELGGENIWVDLDFSTMPAEETKAIVLARQDLIKFVRGTLLRVKGMANQADEESPEEKEKRLKKDRLK